MMSLQIYWDEHIGVTLEEKQRHIYIRDIPEKWQSRICDFMVERSFQLNPLFAHLKIHELPDVEDAYRRYVMHVLRDECSIMIVDEQSNEIFGVALMKCMTKEWRSWTIWMQMFDATTLFSRFMLLIRMLVLKYGEEHTEHELNGLHLFEFYLHPELKADPVFVAKFFNSIFEVARHMSMPRVSFVGITLQEQQLVEAHNFQSLSHLIYSLVEDEGVRAFQSLRDIDEMYMVSFEYLVKPLTPFYRMPPSQPTDEEDRLKREPEEPVDDQVSEAVEGDIYRRSILKSFIK
uniref:Uncharacterized protein n=1 Tax=Ceratitis capitata TaxID=7213 RepID=W8BNF8_CERCA